MLFHLAFAASALALPDFAPIQTYYPSPALRKDQSAAALLELTVDPEGKRIGCETLAIFGDEDLAKDICKLQARAEIGAARDSNGNPAYGVLRVFVRYSIIQTEKGREIYRLEAPGYTHTVTGMRFRSGTRPAPFEQFEAMVGEPKHLLSADATLTVESLPGVEGTMWHQNLIVEVGRDGSLAHCQADAKFDVSLHPAYAKAACDQLALVGLEPLVVEGQPVVHVRRYEVQFRIPEEREAAESES